MAKLSLDATGMCGHVGGSAFFTGKNGIDPGGGGAAGECFEARRRRVVVDRCFINDVSNFRID